jgi:Ankyrin repeats (3 copies)
MPPFGGMMHVRGRAGSRTSEGIMADTERKRQKHTMRFVLYRTMGLLAIMASAVDVCIYRGKAWSWGFGVLLTVVGGIIFLSARAAERNERRVHVAQGDRFFTNPRQAIIKVLLLVLLLIAWLIVARLVLVPMWAETKTAAAASFRLLGLGMVVIVACAVCGQALWDWRQVRRNIHMAVCSGHKEWVERLIEGHPDLAHVPGSYGRMPLHLACALGYTDIAMLLLGAEADATLEADGGWTALHWASMRGTHDLVLALLEAGADVNARAEDGTTPLLWAMRNHRDEAAAALRQHGAEE